MATQTFDLSGLVLLENQIAALQAAQAATPSLFTGGASFNVSYGEAGASAGGAASTMTVAQLRDRVRALHLNVDRLPS